MSIDVISEVKFVICSSVHSSLAGDQLTDDFELAGNVLDSMAVTNLIIALEEHFDFILDDDDLSAEDFETVASLSKLVDRNLNSK